MKSKIKAEFYSGMWTNVVFILGWGVRISDTGVKWFAEKAAVIGWNVLIIQLPTGFSSFADVMNQIKHRTAEVKPDVIISFSMGCIFARHLEAPLRIFLSPYWKIPQAKFILGSYRITHAILSLLRGVNLPLLPRQFSDEDIGIINVSQKIPALISPATMWQVINAQAQLPPLQTNDHVFYCPEDKIIDTSVCRIPNAQQFSGGHDFLCTPDRERVFEQITKILSIHT